MKNIFYILNDKYNKIETDPNGSGIDLVFENVAAADGVELYKGDWYKESLETEQTAEGVKATIPKIYLDGSILHFRIITSGTPGEFLHIIYTKKEPESFKKYNDVIVGNIDKGE